MKVKVVATLVAEFEASTLSDFADISDCIEEAKDGLSGYGFVKEDKCETKLEVVK